MDLYAYVSARIRDLRERFGEGGVSQETVAKGIGVTTNTISRWETATYHPNLDDLDKLARFFGVSILDFLPTDDEQKNERVGALLRAARDLGDEDLEELRRYAEYRRARHILASSKKGRPGRKRKK